MNRKTLTTAIGGILAGATATAVLTLGGTAAAATGQQGTAPATAPGAVHVKCAVPGNSALLPGLGWTVHVRQSLTAWSYRHGTANSDVLVDTPDCAGGGWPLADLRFVKAMNRGSLTVYPGTVLYVVQQP